MFFVKYLPVALAVLGTVSAKPTRSIHLKLTVQDDDAGKPISAYEHTVDNIVDNMIGFTYTAQNVSEACEDLLFDQSEDTLAKIWERINIQSSEINTELKKMQGTNWTDSEVFWLVHTQMSEHLSGEAYAINYVAPKIIKMDAGTETAVRVQRLRTLLNVFDTKLIGLSPECKEGETEDCNGQIKHERDSLLADFDKALDTLKGGSAVALEL